MTAPFNKIEGGVTAPKGFKASGFAAHIKAASTKLDCALIASDLPGTVAGAFTKNLFKSPPCHWNEAACARGKARAIFANSGNANACTGDRGAADVLLTAEQVAAGLNITTEEVCVLSTGVIGLPLPMDRIERGVQGCLEALSTAGSHDAALAIMTTDTVPKEMAFELQLSGGPVRFGAIAKGSGMIAPNMATMFCLITTDAAIEAVTLSPMLKAAVAVSFNQMCIDNDMSTSDTVLCLANGASGVTVKAGVDADAFAAALTHLCREMAKALVRDGEGATKFVEIQVVGAASDDDAKTIARAIAVSQLCKTAFYGEDPNWGRLACAAGYAGIAFNPNRLCIWIDGVKVMHNGMPADFEEAEAAACMRKPEFVIRLETGEGPGSATFWTSDLSHKYVEINADYRT
jgi:glutamate N-acetyltransferase / amino-acid N-acetyltransferase